MLMKLRKFQLLWAAYRKIIYVYLFLVLLPACVLLFFYFEKSSAVLEQQVSESILRAVQQVKINVDYRLSKVSDVSDSLILNDNVYDNLATDPNSGTTFAQVKEQRELSNIIMSLQGSDIYRIKLYVTENKLYANERIHFFSLKDAQAEPWYEEVIGRSGAAYWISSRKQSYIDTGSSVQVLSLARLIRDPNRYSSTIGIMELSVLESNFSAILGSANYSEQEETMFIVNQSGRIVSHSDSTRINEQLLVPEHYAAIANQSTGIYKVTFKDEPYYVIYDTLETTGWKIISLVPSHIINKMNWDSSFASSIVLILSFLLLFILAAFFVFAYVMDGMVDRLRIMTKRLRQRGTGTIEEGISNRRGVVVRLEKGITHMLSTFQQLMEENYQTKIREREAQLRALQSQINPHFLYNALDTINWMALTRGATDISQMLSTLAQYFRLTLNKGKDIVTVEDEMNLAKVYMDIQKERFRSFEYEIEIDDDVLAKMIPKLTVQPIIENAILHGIQNKEGHQGHIAIRVYQGEIGFHIAVSDDGIGMSRDKIDAIMSSLYSQAPASYGLFNVLERIRLFTDNKGTIEIESKEEEGTTVRIHMAETFGSGTT
jgi:two-component system sensor histidine kinase YesM